MALPKPEDKEKTVEAVLRELDDFENVCAIRITGEEAPPPDSEDPVPEWKQIQDLFAKELQALRHTLPRKSRFFSKTDIEPVKYRGDREVLLLRTSVKNRDGSVSLGAAVLDLETGNFLFRNGALAYFTKREMDSWEGKILYLDLNCGGWLLLAGDGKTLRIYDIADKRGKVVLRDSLFDFIAFLENDRYILCREWNKISVIETETGTVCASKRMNRRYEEIYLAGNDSFVVKDGQYAVLCRIEWDPNKVKKRDDRVLSWF